MPFTKPQKMSSAAQHIKARQMLANIDSARAQKELNERLRNTLLDSEDTLVQLHSQLFSVKLQGTIEAIREEADRNLQSFEARLSYSHTCKKHPISRYSDDCGLRLPLNELVENVADGNARAIEILRPLATAHSIADDSFWERFHTLLNRSERLVEAAKLDSSSWCLVVQKVRDAVQSVNLSRPVTKPLSALDDQIHVLGRKNAELSAEEEQAYENGEVSENEAIMAQRIAIMEGISDLITQKFHLIDEEKIQILGRHQHELDDALAQVRSFVKDYRSVAATQKAKIQFDIDALQRTTNQTQKDNHIARASYATNKAQSDARLNDNAAQQIAVWVQIHDLEKQLASLADSRREEVDRRVKLIEREERREMEVRNFETFAQEHQNALTEIFRVCEAKELLAEMLEESCVGACGVAERAVSSASDRMVTLETTAHEEHFAHFREHYLLLGKLQFMKERMLDEYVQRAQVAQSLQELAMDSYNPQAREFALERQRLEDQIQDITNELDIIRKKADLYVEAFKPTEYALKNSSSKPFLHPVQELAQINRSRGRRIAQYHALNVGGFSDPSNAVIDTTAAYAVAERQALEEAKAAKVSTKPTHPNAYQKTNSNSFMNAPDVPSTSLKQMLAKDSTKDID